MAKLSETELGEIIKGGEMSVVELKIKAPRAVDLAERLCGMANAQGGMVIFGVRDSDYEIVGVPDDRLGEAVDVILRATRQGGMCWPSGSASQVHCQFLRLCQKFSSPFPPPLRPISSTIFTANLTADQVDNQRIGGMWVDTRRACGAQGRHWWIAVDELCRWRDSNPQARMGNCF